MNRYSTSLAFLIAFTGIGGGASPAWAHKLLIECKIKGDRIHVEAFYDDNTPAQEAKIVVEAADKRIAAEGRTDDRGVWSCPLPPPGKYTVRAGSVGHAASELLTVSESASTTKKAETPWREMLIGFGVIAGLCLLAILVRRKPNRKPPTGSSD